MKNTVEYIIEREKNNNNYYIEKEENKSNKMKFLLNSCLLI